MERKKGIPLVALIIFVALLVAIILTCAIILGVNKNKKGSTTQDQNANNQIDEPEAVEPVEEVGTEVTDEDYLNSDSTVKEVYKLTGNKKTYAKYAIYSSGGFDQTNDNIKNELKLQLAMSQVTNQDMNKESSTKSVSQDKIEEYVEKIFEDGAIEHKDFSLYDSDTNFTQEYRTVGYKYDEDTESYEVQENEVEEEYPPEITEVVTKATKYNSKIEIFVKPIFVRPFYSEEVGTMGCELFKNYDFQLKDFPEEDSLNAFIYSDYENVLKSDYNSDLDGYNYSTLSQYVDLNQIDEYKYTFIKTDDGYKLQSFIKSKSASNYVIENNSNTELTTEEKEEINSKIEEYTGDDRTGDEAISLLDQIKEINEKNSTRIDGIISVSINGTNANFEDNVDSLNEEIKELEDYIDSDASYTIKATYKSGFITKVTLTSN